MPDKMAKPAGKSSFLREAWRELGRKWKRRKLRATMAQQDRARNLALASLGQKAWEAGVGLDDFTELSGQLKGLEARAGELASTTEKLTGEKAKLEQAQRAEVTRLDARRKALEEVKAPVDASLRAAKEKQSAYDGDARRMESRLTAIAGELAALEREAAMPATPGKASPAALGDKRQQLLSEQTQLSAALPQTRQAHQALTPEVERLTQESRRLAGEIAKVEAEGKTALGQLEASLERVRSELSATSRQSTATGEQRHGRFVQLGQGIYNKRRHEPTLAAAVQAVEKAERELAASGDALQASTALTHAMPRGTMAKFYLTLTGVPVLLLGMGFGGMYLYESMRPQEIVEPPEPPNPYLTHPLNHHSAYALADQLARAKSEQEVADLLRQALKQIHVGIYTADGRQIQAGAERSEKDIYLYDFQVRILARAYFLRNGMTMAVHTRMLGKALLELEEPSQLEPVLNAALVQRFREAEQNPNDPMSYIVFLLDGLARQKLEPYSISEAHRFERVEVDPIQSFLIMLEFFTRPPPPAAASAFGLDWLPSLVPAAHAASCDWIKGDDGKGYWGRGLDLVSEIGSTVRWVGKEAVSIFGHVTGVFGAIGDLLILYGMNIQLVPDPEVIHLMHVGNEEGAIRALVTFDSQGVPQSILECGWILGKQMPVDGPLKDVELKWDFYPDLQGELTMHSRMWAGGDRSKMLLTGTGSGLRTTTDKDGKSTFFIQPSPCPDKEGSRPRKPWVAKVTARFVTKSIPSPTAWGPGLILKLGPGALEYLMNGRTARTKFKAEWHKKKPDEPQY